MQNNFSYENNLQFNFQRSYDQYFQQPLLNNIMIHILDRLLWIMIILHIMSNNNMIHMVTNNKHNHLIQLERPL